MIMEAVLDKVRREDEEARRTAERNAWTTTKNKQNFADLEQFR